MMDIEFNSFRSDGDVRMRITVDTLNLGATTDDGLPTIDFYYEYIIIHVDNIKLSIW